MKLVELIPTLASGKPCLNDRDFYRPPRINQHNAWRVIRVPLRCYQRFMKQSLFSRRALLAGAAACAVPLPATASESSLAALGREKGVEIGSAWGGQGPDAYLRLLDEHCDLIVHEWQLKPRFLKPDQFSAYRFAEADAIADAARARGKKLHGHTLFWHHEPIRWAESTSFSAVRRRYGGFIRDVVSHYADFVSWDVMNEIAEEKTVLRPDFLLDRFGYDFIDFCFRTAHEAAPQARLVLNDYNLECVDRFCNDKRANMLAILRRLKAMGTPVHALGIQSHLSSRWKPGLDATADFIARVADLGFDVYISELDVNDIDFADDIATRDRQVAEAYGAYLSMALSHEAVKRVVFWGLADPASWMIYGDVTRGADARPALFDAGFRPKPAFHAVREALEAAPTHNHR